MFSQVHVIGMQRTGTNFVSTLLRRCGNIDVRPSGDRELFWKHQHPSQPVKSGETPWQIISRSPETLFVLVRKHPAHWLDSIRSRNPQDFFLRNFPSQNPQSISDERLLETYFDYYQSWQSVPEFFNLFPVRYEHTLASPRVELIDKFVQISQSRFTPRLMSASVPFSRRFKYADTSRYLSGSVSEAAQSSVSRFGREDDLLNLGYRNNPPLFQGPRFLWRFGALSSIMLLREDKPRSSTADE